MGKITKESWEYKGKAKFWHWLLFTVLYFMVLMYISGMVGVYVQPIYLGSGQYINIGVVIYILSILIYFCVANYIFKTIKNGRHK